MSWPWRAAAMVMIMVALLQSGCYDLSSLRSSPDLSTPPLQLSNLRVADAENAAKWSFEANLQSGDLHYGDRNYTFTLIPSSLLGSQWVRSAQNSKTFTGNPIVTFTINQPATAYVFYDSQLAPAALDATWTLTSLTADDSQSSNSTFVVYSKSFVAGDIALGPNSVSGSTSVSMYSVIVQ